jgi:nicotinamide riboside kinase
MLCEAQRAPRSRIAAAEETSLIELVDMLVRMACDETVNCELSTVNYCPPPSYNGASMKIALIGSHGVGKTTLCFELAARLKRRNVDVEIVREVARGCPLPINQDTTIAAQEWILHSQVRAEIEAAAVHDAVLCDRSVLDNYCYLVHAAGTRKVWESFLDYWIRSYDVLVHVPLWVRPTFDGVRAVDAGFQEQIELLLEGMITARGLRPVRLEADEQDRWGERIEELLLPRLDPTLPLFPGDSQ